MNPGYRWVIVGVGALMTCVGIGAMFALTIYLEPMSVDTGWSRTGISSAMTLDFLVMGAASFAAGAASDRFGAAFFTPTLNEHSTIFPSARIFFVGLTYGFGAGPKHDPELDLGRP